jgi:AcrR family transcriptional regulator
MNAQSKKRTKAAFRRPGRPRVRQERSAERRQAILDAALEEFSANGFAGTRLDDVARRAGVAKGTIYLYFNDKESLFQELVRAMFAPIVNAMVNAPPPTLPVRDTIEKLIEMFVREVLGTRRKDVIRLIITEGPRFPKLAEFHHREVVSRVMAAISALMARAVERGEIRTDTYVKFPQLVVAPGLVAVIWSGLFDRYTPLDVAAMMRAHLDNIFGERKTS